MTALLTVSGIRRPLLHLRRRSVTPLFQPWAILAAGAAFLIAVGIATLTSPAAQADTTPSITIVKDAVPNDAADFPFDIVTGGGTGSAPPFSLDDDPGDATLPDRMTFYFQPGTYQVVEGASSSPGWHLDGIVCDDPSGDTTTSLATGSATIDLDVGEQITCTFTNRLTSITIVKDAVPNDAADFPFDIVTGGGTGSAPPFSLDDDPGDATLPDRMTFYFQPGTYQVVEGASSSPGWHLDGIVCDDPSGDTTTSLATGSATIDLDVGEQITCTFTNRLTSITIVKDAVPNDAADFPFDIVTGGGTGSAPPFSLDDDPGDATLPDRMTFYFQPGTYQVVEGASSSPGWHLDGIVCDDPSGDTTTSLATGSATIDLDVGEQITCTFTNRLTSITIVKDAVPNDAADFTFDTVPSISAPFTLDDDAGAAAADDTFQGGMTFFVNPGTYRFIERDPAPSGWRVDSITCEDPSNGTTTSVSTRTATIDLDVGERITCTFTNRINPAHVTLSPTEATNPVGTSHTVTATVTDAFGAPVANTTVQFTVSGSVNTTGSCTTGPAGTCSFSYTGPAFPGADSMAGCADANNSGTPDIGEPCSEKVAKAWILPASTPGQVTGGGHVIDPADNEKVAFGFNAQSGPKGFKGNCTVVDVAPSRNVKIKCLDVTTLVQTSTSATIYGRAEINGTATGYRIDVTDLAEPGRDRDTFAIQTTSGYFAGGTIDGGNIQVHRAE